MKSIDHGTRRSAAVVRTDAWTLHLIAAAGLYTLASLSAVGPARAADGTSNGDYQIVKATSDRVWRLNKKSGEIAVCSLEGDNLICTTSSEAIKPPGKTFEQRQAEIEKSKADTAKRRDEERAKDLAFLDRAFQAIKSLIQAAMERDAPADGAAN